MPRRMPVKISILRYGRRRWPMKVRTATMPERTRPTAAPVTTVPLPIFK